jgi:diguanylate cyclase
MELRRARKFSDWAHPANELVGMTDNARRPVVLTIAWAQRLVILLVAIDITSTFFRKPGHSYLWDSGFYQGIELLPAFLAGMKAVYSQGTYRKVWIAFCLALTCAAASETIRTIQDVMGLNPTVSIADFVNLSFYPFMCIAVTLLMRAQVKQVPRSVWLDGAIGATACAAFALVFQYTSIVAGASGGTPLEDGVALAYPVADVLVISLLAALLPMSGWRPDRVWWLIAGGLALNASGDFATVHVANFQPGTPWDIPWDLTWLCLALAPWAKPKVVDRIAFHNWSIVAMPVFFSAISLGVLFTGAVTHLATITVILAMLGVLGGLIRLGLTFREIRSLAESRKQARTDELTDLGNRRYFYEQATAILHHRSTHEPLALLVIDLDRFKEINDSLGHQLGDSLLRQLGPRLQHALHKENTIARMGGDEFALILDGANEEVAIDAAKKILATIDEPFLLDDVPIRISASVGIALYPEHATEPNGLLQHADVAMYRAKREHSGPQVYHPEHDALTRERLQSIHQLRRALERHEIAVFYQPKVNAHTGAFAGAEALVRLQHPTREQTTPEMFLPLAEQADLMQLLTTQVIENVLDDCVRWREAGSSPIQIAINLSVTNLLDVDFPNWTSDALASRNIDPSQLIFEVTESTMLSDVRQARQTAIDLRDLGSGISLDDYGTGYASLAYLREFPLNELKLDRSFVTDLEGNPVAQTFVRSTIEIAHALGLRVVAEGIESDEMWRTVAAVGADVCQGYFFCKPLSGAKFYDYVVLGQIRRRQIAQAAAVAS